MQGNHNRDFTILAPRAAAAEITRHLQEGGPMSFIRLGDGEGLVLSLCEESSFDDLHHLSTHFGGPGVSLGNVFRLRDEMIAAATHADIVGVRDDVVGVRHDPELFDLGPGLFEREFKRRFPLRTCDAGLPANACRRLALLNRVLETMHFPASTLFTSAWTHWDLAASGQLYRWIGKQQRIGLITSRANLPALLEDLLQVEVKSYFVPDMYKDSLPKISGAHFPNRYEELRSELSVDYPGMLFLVGAGICGKIYCRWIKDRGGVALDIGAVLDTWTGIGSRPAVFRDRFGNADFTGGVPSDLLLNRKNVQRLLTHSESTLLSQ